MKIQSFEDHPVFHAGPVVVAGGSGLIGTACRTLLTHHGYEVVTLTRSDRKDPGYVRWDPDHNGIAENIVDGARAVINLCGVSLAEQRWTASFRKQLVESRTTPARFLGELISRAERPPDCYIGASAIGIYGDRGDTPVHEGEDCEADGFAADLIREWEQAHLETNVARKVVLRIGIVLSREGGFLQRILPPTRFGLYPCFGNGRQLLSWVHLDDLAQMILAALRNRGFAGTYHATAPGAVSQCELMRIVREISRRHGLLFHVPRWSLRLLFGEMAGLLFESNDIRPQRYLDAGFQFRYPGIREAIWAEIT